MYCKAHCIEIIAHHRVVVKAIFGCKKADGTLHQPRGKQAEAAMYYVGGGGGFVQGGAEQAQLKARSVLAMPDVPYPAIDSRYIDEE